MLNAKTAVLARLHVMALCPALLALFWAAGAQADVAWPSKWKVFLPVDRDAPPLPAETLADVPETIEVAGQTLEGRWAEAEGLKEVAGHQVGFEHVRLDLEPLFGEVAAGNTAYVFVPFESAEGGAAVLGMGADWWMQAWLNGELVVDTTESGNQFWPPGITDYTAEVQLKTGRNVLAVRFVSGSGSSVLALGGPHHMALALDAIQGTFPEETVAVPDGQWGRTGTLAFRFRPSRTLRFRPESPLDMTLLESPVVNMQLTEHLLHCVFRVQMAVEGAVGREVRGGIDLSHLKGGKWYDVVFSWDADAGLMELYLNGQKQAQLRRRARIGHPWPAPKAPSGDIKLGGTFGSGDAECRLEVDAEPVFVHPEFMDEAQAAALLEGQPVKPLVNEGRWNHDGALDLSPYALELVYAEDFAKPLDVIHEDDLFDGQRRRLMPAGEEWVLEGRAAAWTEGGECVVRQDKENPSHAVLWNTREFPADMLVEFGMTPKDPERGLAIIFFATRNVHSGSPFAMWLPKRAGDFRTYHSGKLDCYHISYWAGERRAANLRKNKGFFMPAVGIDRVKEDGAGPHIVRLLKVGGKIRLEVNGRLALVFDDDGETYGPAWLHDGWIGLRQMAHAEEVRYSHFKVWKVTERP